MARTWIPIIVAAISAFAVIMAAFIQSSRSNEQRPYGAILAPIEDQNVGVLFSVQGELRSIPQEGHIWIAVQDNNLIWPKEEISYRHGSWLRTVSHTGQGDDKFAVVLLLVDDEGQSQILDWFRLGNKTGAFPGMRLNAESKVLDIVQLHSATVNRSWK